jgi:hypothetical protein
MSRIVPLEVLTVSPSIHRMTVARVYLPWDDAALAGGDVNAPTPSTTQTMIDNVLRSLMDRPFVSRHDGGVR